MRDCRGWRGERQGRCEGTEEAGGPRCGIAGAGVASGKGGVKEPSRGRGDEEQELSA
jgi:hypothetical protein